MRIPDSANVQNQCHYLELRMTNDELKQNISTAKLRIRSENEKAKPRRGDIFVVPGLYPGYGIIWHKALARIPQSEYKCHFRRKGGDLN